MPSMTLLSLLSVCLVVSSISACQPSDNYCLQLKQIASDVSVQEALDLWVSEYVAEKELRRDQLHTGRLMIPGYWHESVEGFDWNVLGFDARRAQVRLLVDDFASSDEYIRDIPAVYFGEKSRRGLLVALGEDSDWGLSGDRQYLTLVTPTLGVLCISSD